jgi:antitoxin YefM
MAKETSYSAARANFALLCERVVEEQEPVVIHRRGAEDVALVSAAELRSLEETAHLLRSPRNAKRLFEALRAAERRRGARLTGKALRKRAGLGTA